MTLQEQLVRFRPPRIAMSLVAVAAVVHFALPLGALPSLGLGAALLAVAGFAIMLRAWWLFRTVETAICPTGQTTTLITTDVYAQTRNPMYLGMFMMLVALALYAGSPSFYAAAIVNFLILNFVFCPYEERRLRATFSQFDEYASRVRRWI